MSWTWRDVFNRGTLVAGWAASIFGAGKVLHEYWPKVTSDAQFAMAILATYAAFFLAYSMWQEYRMAAKTRYADALQYYHKAVCSCLPGPTGVESDNELILRMKSLCTHLATCLTAATRTKVAVCLKYVETSGAEGRLVVGQLCRDEISDDRRKCDGDTTVHWVDDNTDFAEIFENKGKPTGRFFMENNLPGRLYYKNTSFKIYGKPDEEKQFWRRRKWPLPYKSTLVVPIKSMPSYDIIGFICIDSNSINSFWKRYDVDILETTASVLHPFVNRVLEILETKRGGALNGEE